MNKYRLKPVRDAVFDHGEISECSCSEYCFRRTGHKEVSGPVRPFASLTDNSFVLSLMLFKAQYSLSVGEGYALVKSTIYTDDFP